jgi:transposase
MTLEEGAPSWREASTRACGIGQFVIRFHRINLRRDMMVAVAIRRDIEASELRRLARLERDGRVSSRLLALAAVLDGVSREQAARIGGMDRQTLRDWVHRFNEAGVAGLRDRARPGRPCLLAEELLPELAALIADGPQVERDGVVEFRLSHIRALSLRHFGADYSQGGMHAVLRRMGFSWLKPRPIHPKTDLAAQDTFKKTSARRWHASVISIPKSSGWRSGSRTKPGSARKAR